MFHIKAVHYSQVYLLLITLIYSAVAISAPKKVLIEQWQASDELSTQVINHQPWQNILDKYLSTVDRQTYVNYHAASQDTQLGLDTYITTLSNINPLSLNRNEQKAYWLNLYNAATVQLILKHYPVKSITKIGRGFFAFGPWNDNILVVNQTPISLNDIEHGILRPIYNDPRIHYGVNCASLSCPNLMATAYTSANSEALLDQAAKDYINHARGVNPQDQTLLLSTIYQWYQQDFGDNVDEMIEHLKIYAEPKLLAQLQLTHNWNIKYDYDWRLNSPESK